MADEKVMVCGYPLREAPTDAMVLVIENALVGAFGRQFSKRRDDAQLVGAEVRRRLERLAALEKVAEEAVRVVQSDVTTMGGLVLGGGKYCPSQDRVNFHKVRACDMHRLRRALEKAKEAAKNGAGGA